MLKLISLIIVFYSAPALTTPVMDTKNVHGQFVRTQVINLNEFRYKVTGLLYDTKSTSSCTGTLIGPKHVLTAAHCVYNFKTKEWGNSLMFTPGKLATKDAGFGSFSFRRIFLQKEYMDSMNEDYDFALIELDSSPGDSIGWAGFRALEPLESSEGTEFPVTFSGYPGDKEFGTLWTVLCPATVKKNLLSYYCDSFAGMSGSSIFQPGDSDNFVIGVHTVGGHVKNGGVFLNSRNFELLNSWKNKSSWPSNTVIYSKK